MAVQPKKKRSTTKSKTTAKKKPTTKKTTVKSRKRKSKKKSHTKRNILIVLVLFVMFSFVGFGFYLGQHSDGISSAIERGEIEGEYTTKQLLEDLSKIQHKIPKEEKKAVVPKKKVKPQVIQKIKVPQPKSKVPKRVAVEKTVLTSSLDKPKLAIIIDDVFKQRQLDAMRATGIKMTPSIFPPFELSMTSHHLAKGLKHYMIHLPMESNSKQFNSQYKTLHTSFTHTQIDKRVDELRTLFPKAKYINNHTGSVFTNNYKAMDILYRALRKEGFVFVDSRTVGSSKVKKIAKEFGDAYLSRDIFIDNKHTVNYIHQQLAKAVKIAKKRGYAVAIGHPHKVTMRALASANDILKEVELVYIDELYKRK